MRFDLANIEDRYVRESFRLLQEYLKGNSILDGFVHVDFTVDGARSNVKVRHGLGHVPMDIVKSRITGSGTLVMNYDLFDSEYIDVTTTDSCRFRGFIGTYKNAAAVVSDA